MERLNAQKLLANQGEGMKAFHYLCGYSLMRCFFSLQAAHKWGKCAVCTSPRCLNFNPPVNRLHEWVGTMSTWRGSMGDDGREIDTPLVSLFIRPGSSPQIRSWKWEGWPRPLLCKVLCVCISPPTMERRGGVQMDRRLRKMINNEWSPGWFVLHILSWRLSEVMVGLQCQKNWLNRWDLIFQSSA